jgi:hypothetical protein
MVGRFGVQFGTSLPRTKPEIIVQMQIKKSKEKIPLCGRDIVQGVLLFMSPTRSLGYRKIQKLLQNPQCKVD